MFAGHVEFYGYEDYVWPKSTSDEYQLELIEPIDFLRRYDATSGSFGSASFVCVLKEALSDMGKEPFKISGVDDAYLCMSLTLLGSVAYSARAACRVSNHGGGAIDRQIESVRTVGRSLSTIGASLREPSVIGPPEEFFDLHSRQGAVNTQSGSSVLKEPSRLGGNCASRFRIRGT